MDVSTIPLENVIHLESHPAGQDEVDFFASGTLNCLLSCTKELRNRRKTSHAGAGAVCDTPHFRFNDLVVSAGTDCRGCQFLRALLEGACQAYPEIKMGDTILKWLGSRYTLQIEPKNANLRRIQFFYPRGANRRVVTMPTSNILTGDTSSDKSFIRAHSFIQSCEVQHVDCGTGRHVPLPKRLINVKQITNSKGDIGVRLDTTEGKIGTYSCLSHCWGDPALIISKLTSITMHDYHSFIPWSDLPKTFRDAIILCRRLGLEYIWIDSLCIVQDSARDWEDQSSKMGDIYGQGYITIAAVASPDSSGGCFSNSVPDVLVVVRDCQGTGDVKRSDEAFARLYPLFKRAWVYQERMLSRRTLYCNKLELQVGCRTALHCECGTNTFAPHFPTLQSPFNIARLREPSQIVPYNRGGGASAGDQRTMSVYRKWLDIVESFAKLNLTRGGDKLPALSATTQHIAQSINSDYLAGIWRVSLMEGLLWFVRGGPSKPRPRGQHWRAPSWSWASIDAPSGLGYMAPGERFSDSFRGKVKAAECKLAGQDKMGQVISGFIRIEVSLGKAFWRRCCSICKPTRTGRRGLGRVDYTLHAALPSKTDAQDNGNHWVPCNFSQPGLDLMGGHFSFFADGVVDDLSRYGFVSCTGKGSCKVAPCYLLHVPRYKRRHWTNPQRADDNNNNKGEADAFLVLSLATSSSDTFERVGLVQACHDTGEKRSSWFQKVWSSIVLPEKTITLI